jgi:hypothetical protein
MVDLSICLPSAAIILPTHIYEYAQRYSASHALYMLQI